MNKNIHFVLLILLLPFFIQAQAITQKSAPVKVKRWYHLFRTNAFDKEGAYHGRWKIYINNDRDLIRNGRFSHGKEVGTWRYYYPEGGLYMVEKHKRRSDAIKITKYHENGKLARIGQARMVNTDKEVHYYYEGVWQVYDEQGNFTHTETYLKGNLQSKQSIPAAR